MELRHIRYFTALAEELNFSRAAERLHIAQPPLSRQIKELEEELGAKLFYRSKRQVQLTDAGKAFLRKAYQILDQVEQASISARLASTGREGELRIGFSGSVQDLIPTLRQYRELYPQVGIVLYQMNSTLQIEALNESRIDLAVLSVPAHHPKIETFPLRKVQFMAVLPENHHLVTKRSLRLEDLKEETFIITLKSSGMLFHEAFMSIFQSASYTPNVTFQASDLQTVLALVASGMGVTLTPSPINPVAGIVKRNVDDIDLSMQVSLAWRKDTHSEIMDNFLQFFYVHYIELKNQWDNEGNEDSHMNEV